MAAERSGPPKGLSGRAFLRPTLLGVFRRNGFAVTGLFTIPFFVKSLIEGKLPWETLKDIMPSPKDEDRLNKVIEIEQERVPWKEKIFLPMEEHLYILRRGPGHIVKCLCGNESSNCRRNWRRG